MLACSAHNFEIVVEIYAVFVCSEKIEDEPDSSYGSDDDQLCSALGCQPGDLLEHIAEQ
ncbi:helix-turn-helix domain-containing protein [Paenibacillus lautus]|uniref:helix-turn-helix domain-containing protein n=1 Tax=Paenibacillus TaxID=44249 RepID=UPI0009FAED44